MARNRRVSPNPPQAAIGRLRGTYGEKTRSNCSGLVTVRAASRPDAKMGRWRVVSGRALDPGRDVVDGSS